MCDIAKGEADQFDVIASNSHSEGLSVFQGQVQNTEISDSVGLGVRVIKDGRPGYAHTERLTDEALRQTLKDALCHTQWTEKIDITLPQAVELPKDEPNYNPALESLDLATMKDFCIELEKQTFAKSKEIENIPYLGGDIEHDYSIVANNTGLFYEARSNCASAGAGAVASRDGIKKLGNFVKNGRNWNDFSVEEIATCTTNRFSLKPCKRDNPVWTARKAKKSQAMCSRCGTILLAKCSSTSSISIPKVARRSASRLLKTVSSILHFTISKLLPRLIAKQPVTETAALVAKCPRASTICLCRLER